MYQCEQCNKSFKSKASLGSHKSHHTKSRKTKPETFQCIQCHSIKPYSHGSKNKFCSNICQGEYKWQFITLPKLKDGKGSAVSLKKYLIKNYGYKCSICNISEWMGETISLHLDHIDGNSDNNQISNGRILCPNCHSQTETFSGKNTKNTKRNSYLQNYKSNKKQKGKGR